MAHTNLEDGRRKKEVSFVMTWLRVDRDGGEGEPVFGLCGSSFV